MLRQLRRASFDRGLLGGSRPWIVVGAVLWAARGVRIATRRQRGVVWRGALGAGEVISVAARRGGSGAGGGTT